METKLWFALCALLLLNLASGDNGSDGPQNKSHAKLTDNHSPTSHTSPSPTSTTHPSTNSSVNTEIIMSPSTNHSTSNQSTPSLPSSTTLSNQTTQNTINTSTATVAPTITPATNTTLATKAITQPSSTSSSSNQTTTSEFDGQPRASSNLPPNVTIIPSSSTSTHVDNPSQLNVEGDTKMVHESATLDPLLAGLVSAFIIAAVIITLLLFLKLRRRDNRPEFRRLQDLPMDDIMEDAPLSMYSY